MDNKNFNKIKDNFKLRNMDVEYFDGLEAVKSRILNLIPTKSMVGVGHSDTIKKSGVIESLIDRGNTVYDKERGKTDEECNEIKKKAIITDWYITGSNAVTIDGRIINIDHSGNRVAAISFGPDKVIIVVGKNKIVETVQEGIKRIKDTACPMSAKKAGYNPPCVVLNSCIDCVSKERVCNSLSIIEGQVDSDRIKVFIVDEEHGF